MNPDTIRVYFALTNKCNLSCPYCYQSSSKDSSKRELSLEQKLNLIEQFAESNISDLIFTGGEPTVSPDLNEVVEYASKFGIPTGLLTNGTLLTTKRVEKLKTLGLEKVCINLKEEKYEECVGGIINSVAGGLKVVMALTVTRKNFSYIENFIKFARYLGVDEIELGSILPVGRAKSMKKEESLTPEENMHLIETVTNNISDNGYKSQRIFVEEPYFFVYIRNNLEDQKILQKYSIAEGCGAGISSICIQPDGLVTPCILTPELVVGDIKKDPFIKIWKNSSLLNKLRSRENLEGKCGSCGDKYICGGCRARAYAITGDIFAEDPYCTKKQTLKT